MKEIIESNKKLILISLSILIVGIIVVLIASFGLKGKKNIETKYLNCSYSISNDMFSKYDVNFNMVYTDKIEDTSIEIILRPADEYIQNYSLLSNSMENYLLTYKDSKCINADLKNDKLNYYLTINFDINNELCTEKDFESFKIFDDFNSIESNQKLDSIKENITKMGGICVEK